MWSTLAIPRPNTPFEDPEYASFAYTKDRNFKFSDELPGGDGKFLIRSRCRCHMPTKTMGIQARHQALLKDFAGVGSLEVFC